MMMNDGRCLYGSTLKQSRERTWAAKRLGVGLKVANGDNGTSPGPVMCRLFLFAPARRHRRNPEKVRERSVRMTAKSAPAVEHPELCTRSVAGYRSADGSFGEIGVKQAKSRDTRDSPTFS